MIEQYRLTNEQKMLKETVRRMAREKIGPRAAKIDETGGFPWDVCEEFRTLGLFGLVFPEEYGGSDAGILSAALVLEEIARVCSSSSLICASPIVVGHIILAKGDEGQKNKYLPTLASGKKMAAFALSEPETESDVAGITTRAEKKGMQYVVNGTKCFVMLADVAGLLMVFAKTETGGEKECINAFIIENNAPGCSLSRTDKTLGTRAVTACELIFNNCVITEDNRIGDEGDGFSIAMKAMMVGCVVTAARGLGLAQGALDYALEYSRKRIQFGRPISSFQGIRFMLADMAMLTEAGRSILYKACGETEQGGNEMRVPGLMAKCFVTDAAMKVTTDAVQILGGYGYMKDHPVERMMRDAKLTQVIEGTNQMQRLLLGREILV